MFYFMLSLLGFAVVLVAGAAIRNTYHRPMYRPQGATRVVRPYAIVEAYDAQGNAVLPTIVYDADQLDMATERYVKLGCAVVVGTVIDAVH